LGDFVGYGTFAFCAFGFRGPLFFSSVNLAEIIDAGVAVCMQFGAAATGDNGRGDQQANEPKSQYSYRPKENSLHG
jgi:hypothetical protein